MRRFLISIGVASPGPPLPDLPAVRRDVERLRALFVGALGYTPGPALDNPSAAELRSALDRWLAAARLTADDAVVVYYSGHGHVAPAGHYLYTRGFHKDATADGLRSQALIEIVLGRKARPGKLWLILDCCQAGGVLRSELYREIAAVRTDTFVLAASGSFGQAADGAFSGAFCSAVRRLGGGASLDRLTGAINGLTGAGLMQPRLPAPAVQLSLASRPFDLLDGRRPGAPPGPRTRTRTPAARVRV